MLTQGTHSRRAATPFFILLLAAAAPASSDITCPLAPPDPACAQNAKHQTFTIDGNLAVFYAVRGSSSPPQTFTISVDNTGCQVKMKVNTHGPFAVNLNQPEFKDDWDFSTTGDCGFDGASATGTIRFHPTRGDSSYVNCVFVAHDSGNSPTPSCAGRPCGCKSPEGLSFPYDVELRLEGRMLERSTNLVISPPPEVRFGYGDVGPPVAYPSNVVTVTLSTDGGPESIDITCLELASLDPRFPLPLGYAQVQGPNPTDPASANHSLASGRPVNFDILLVPALVRPGRYSTPSVEIVVHGVTNLTRTATTARAELVVSAFPFLPSMPTLGAWGQLALILSLLAAGSIALRRRRA